MKYVEATFAIILFLVLLALLSTLIPAFTDSLLQVLP